MVIYSFNICFFMFASQQNALSCLFAEDQALLFRVCLVMTQADDLYSILGAALPVSQWLFYQLEFGHRCTAISCLLSVIEVLCTTLLLQSLQHRATVHWLVISISGMPHKSWESGMIAQAHFKCLLTTVVLVPFSQKWDDASSSRSRWQTMLIEQAQVRS